ncbi:AraC family transcriptional regulator [Duganella sp. Dugasp56]|uniref:AraC family transcriptional regulator n=1 Tax=Duganella sp. Dugasp56 TaxID=3243046 RepID=UPI00159D3E34
MPIPVVTHTQFNWDCDYPTPARPLTMSGRDLPADAVLLPHHHPWGQFTYALQGVMRVTANNSSWIVPPQRAVWIAPDVVHAVTVLEPTRLRPLCVHASRSPFADDCKVVEVSGLLRELMAAFEQHDQHEQSSREQLLADMILDELPRCAERPLRVPLPQDKRLKTLCNALIDDPGAELTLEAWSARVGASERTLTRLFERELGMSFSQWRQQVRLAHAAPLITRGVPLSQVAAQLGYASQSAFSAMFKKTFGSTPTAFFGQK